MAASEYAVGEKANDKDQSYEERFGLMLIIIYHPGLVGTILAADTHFSLDYSSLASRYF